MRYTRYLAAAFAALLAFPLVGCVGEVESDEPAAGELESAVRLVNVRSGPGFNFPVVYQVPIGVRLPVACYTNDRFGNYWYMLRDGNYVLASLVPFTLTSRCISIWR